MVSLICAGVARQLVGFAEVDLTGEPGCAAGKRLLDIVPCNMYDTGPTMQVLYERAPPVPVKLEFVRGHPFLVLYQVEFSDLWVLLRA